MATIELSNCIDPDLYERVITKSKRITVHVVRVFKMMIRGVIMIIRRLRLVERLHVKGSQLLGESLNIYLAFQELPLSGPTLL